MNAVTRIVVSVVVECWSVSGQWRLGKDAERKKRTRVKTLAASHWQNVPIKVESASLAIQSLPRFEICFLLPPFDLKKSSCRFGFLNQTLLDLVKMT